MSMVSVRMGKTLHERVKEFAQFEGLSVNQCINSLLQESLLRREYRNMWRSPKEYSEQEIDDVLKKIT